MYFISELYSIQFVCTYENQAKNKVHINCISSKLTISDLYQNKVEKM